MCHKLRILSYLAVLIASIAVLPAAETPAAAEAATPLSPSPAPADATLENLQRLLTNPGLSENDRRAIYDAVQRLERTAARQMLSADSNRLADQLRDELQKRYAAHPGDRGFAALFARYLLFLDDAPAALTVLEKMHPASEADAAWPLAMAGVYLQLGDQRKTAAYLTQTETLLAKNSAFALSPPVAVSKVGGYRLYTPDARTVFSPGETVILYVEIQSARFKIRGNEWQCQLDFGLELLNSAGNVCDRNPDYGRYDPTYNGNVREIHASVYYHIPDTLPAGAYTLRLTCRDLVAAASASADYSLTIGGKTERKDLRQERKVDAEAYQKILENNIDPLAPDAAEDPLKELSDELKKKYMLQGLGLSRERSKMQGGLLNRE